MPPTPRRTSSRHLSRSVVPTRACARATNGSLAPAEVDLTAPSSRPATSPRSAIAYVPSFEVVDQVVGQVSNIHTFPGNRTRGNRIVKRTRARAFSARAHVIARHGHDRLQRQRGEIGRAHV